VLAEPALDQLALRHLNALLSGYQLQRELHRHLLATASDARERVIVHLSAIESLGRLEQALYGAHLTFRSQDRPGPAPRAASSMRRAAHELVEHLDALRAASLFGTSQALGIPPDDVLRAAAHALRGLRTARVATRDAAPLSSAPSAPFAASPPTP
jgi:hypothetical protein